MSRSFSDPSRAEESFRILNQQKDSKIWEILTLILDPSTTFNVAWALQVFHILNNNFVNLLVFR